MGINHLPILLILGVVALIIFGPKRLPELGHGLGKAITEFKKGVSELTGSGAGDHVTEDSAAPIASQPSVIATPSGSEARAVDPVGKAN